MNTVAHNGGQTGTQQCSSMHCEEDKAAAQCVACFPSMGVPLLLLPLRLGPPVLGTHAGGHAVPRVVKQATVVLGRSMRTLAVAPPAETPLVSHAPPIILPGFRATHIVRPRVA